MIQTTHAQSASVAERVMLDIDRLRPLPISVTRAIRLLGQDDVDLKKVANVLADDEVVVSMILKHANSVYYGGRISATTVIDSIMRIGINELKHVLYGLAAVGPLTARLAAYSLDQGELFRHSAVVAASARRVSQILRIAKPEEAYTAGLLHDIGKLLLERHLRPYMETLENNPDLSMRPHVEIENFFLDIDHTIVGAQMAERWHYPSVLSECIRFHHAPSLATKPELPAIVLLADTIVLFAGIGVTPLGFEPLHPAVPEILDLSYRTLMRLGNQMREEIIEIDQEFTARHSE